MKNLFLLIVILGLILGFSGIKVMGNSLQANAKISSTKELNNYETAKVKNLYGEKGTDPGRDYNMFKTSGITGESKKDLNKKKYFFF